jgi:tetratricopeptide (TPR) repeat protein
LLLQLIHVYGTPKHEEKLHQILSETLREEGVPDSVLTVALELYRPSRKTAEEKELRDIVNGLNNRKTAPLSREALAHFFSKFSDHENTAFLLDWLREKHKVLYQDRATPFLLGIAKLRSDTKGHPEVLKALVAMAGDANREKSQWATDALRLLTTGGLHVDAGPEARRDAVQSLMAKADEPLANETKELSPDTRSTRLGPLLVGLIRVEEDDEFIAQLIPDKAAPKALQTLLADLSKRLKDENKKLPPKIVERLFQLADPFDGPGLSDLMIHVLRGGEPKHGADFLARFADWHIEVALRTPDLDAPTGPGAIMRTQLSNALRVAVENDAKSAQPFLGTTKLLKSLAELSIDDSKLIRVRLRSAIDSYCSAPQRRLEDLIALREELTRVNAKKEDYIYREFMPAIDQAQRFLIGRQAFSGKLDESLDSITSRIRAQPKDSHWHYVRGSIQFDVLRQHDEALRDLDEAIRLDPGDPSYYEKRGDVYRKSGKLAKAISDYDQALCKLADYEQGVRYLDQDVEKLTAEMNQRRRSVYHKLALAHIQTGVNDTDAEKSVQLAEKFVQLAVEMTKTIRDKAGSEENLGLLYLKKRDWHKALSHSADVNKKYYGMNWNWMIRYIAAKEAGDQMTADQAYKTWMSLRATPSDFASLYDIIPSLLKKHFGVTSVKEGRLTGQPAVGTRFGKSVANVETIPCIKGGRYIIDMESGVLDSYLTVKDPSGNVVREDNHGGGGRNARVDFVAGKPGSYQVVATSYGGRAQGAYTLIIREPPGENTASK